MNKNVLILTFLAAFLPAAGAAETGAAASSTTLTPVAYPVIMYSPETSLVLGGGAVLILRRSDAAAAAKPDSVAVNLMYSLKSQTVLQFAPETYSRDELYKFSANVVYSNMPTSFFGVGNSPGLSSEELEQLEEKYTGRAFMFRSQCLRSVWGPLRAGLVYDFRNSHAGGVPAGGRLAAAHGISGGRQDGLGAVLDYDTRDNLFSPSAGVYAQAVAGYYKKALGSDYQYDRYSLDLRGYRSLGKDRVLALQFAGAAAGRDVPFYDMPLYGLRGIYNDYFADRASYSVQAEYRFPLKKRFSAVVFAGGGDSAPEIGRLSVGNMQFVAGSGIRFCMSEKEKVNIRLDIGASKWGTQSYLNVSEAF